MAEISSEEKFNAYYNYLDEQMIEGNEEAENLIQKFGYKIDNTTLFDFVDKKVLEGDTGAKTLVDKYGLI